MRALYYFLIAAALSPAPAWAEEPPPFRDFTFKKVKPPKSGSKKRIDIQIEADDIERRRGKSTNLLAHPKPAAGPPESEAQQAGKAAPHRKTGAYKWFWENVSPKLEQSGPGRLAPALVQLSKGPGGPVAAPRLDVLRPIIEARGADILRATIGTDVSPALVLAVIAIESGGRAKAESRAGAQGLMQLMPATAERFGVADALEPRDNIKGGVAYLDLLMKEFDGDPIMVLASYNAGENAVRKAGGVPDYAETREYVPKVLAAFGTARALCMTPPELVSDGCVFNLELAQAGQ